MSPRVVDKKEKKEQIIMAALLVFKKARVSPAILFAITVGLIRAHTALRRVVFEDAHHVVEVLALLEEVVSTGGHDSTSTNYTNVSTTGQSGTVGVHNSTNYENQSGFWHTVFVELPIPTLSSIGLILLMLGMGFILLRRKVEGERVQS